MEEIWKDLKGYEGLYKISSLGKIKSLDRKRYCGHKGNKPQLRKGRILKQHYDYLGYKRVRLSKNSTTKTLTLHRLLAINFIENPYNKPNINHIDGNKANNNLNNLEWCTQKENVQHSYNLGLSKGIKGEQNNKSKLKAKDIKEIRKLHKQKKTQTDIAKMFNVSIANISEIVNYKTWKEV